MQSVWRALLEYIELMPQDQDFGFQPRSRLEAVAQHADEKEANCNLRESASRMDRVFGSLQCVWR
jgi:hypothetical protein